MYSNVLMGGGDKDNEEEESGNEEGRAHTHAHARIHTHTLCWTVEPGVSPGKQILWAWSPPHVRWRRREGGRERGMKVTHE